jgi:hypothetical protein
MGDLATLDFDADDSRAFDGDQEVDLVVLEMIGDSLAGDHQVTVTELRTQGGPDTPFGGTGQAGVIGQRDGHFIPSRCVWLRAAVKRTAAGCL